MPDPTLQATALRYAAGDLSPDEVSAFEARLAEDQDARDALAEAVRLSAAAIGQKPPAPHPSFRTLIRARLGLVSYRGHPLAWVGLGAAAVAACAIFAVSLPTRSNALEAEAAVRVAPAGLEVPQVVPRDAVAAQDAGQAGAENPPAGCGDERSVAEIWADLSSHDHVEKARDDEMRWRQRVRELSNPNHVSATAKGCTDP
jgi:hypothetical protein